MRKFFKYYFTKKILLNIVAVISNVLCKKVKCTPLDFIALVKVFVVIKKNIEERGESVSRRFLGRFFCSRVFFAFLQVG